MRLLVLARAALVSDFSFVRMGRGRGSRRVRYVSEVDQRLIALGLAPSWEEGVSEGDVRFGLGEVETNDQRLLENVPPHSHAKLS